LSQQSPFPDKVTQRRVSEQAAALTTSQNSQWHFHTEQD